MDQLRQRRPLPAPLRPRRRRNLSAIANVGAVATGRMTAKHHLSPPDRKTGSVVETKIVTVTVAGMTLHVADKPTRTAPPEGQGGEGNHLAERALSRACELRVTAP